MLNLNKDVINLILNNLDDIGTLPVELHDFMAASKEIYDLSLEWRQKHWTIGNHMLKPYQVRFGENNICSTFYSHEEYEITMLNLIISYAGGNLVFALVDDFDKWKRITAECGINSTFVENLADHFDELDYVKGGHIFVKENPYDVIDNALLTNFEHCIITDTDIELFDGVYKFVFTPEEARCRTVLRKNWYKAEVKESRIMTHFAEKMEELMSKFNKIHIVDFNIYATKFGHVNEIDELANKCGFQVIQLDYNFLLPTVVDKSDDKIIYHQIFTTNRSFYVRDFTHIMAPNLVILDVYISANEFITSYYEPRTINMIRMYTDLERSLSFIKSKYNYIAMRYNQRNDPIYGFHVASLFGIDFFALHDVEQYALSVKITDNELAEKIFNEWKTIKRYSLYGCRLTEDQVRAYLMIQ